MEILVGPENIFYEIKEDKMREVFGCEVCGNQQLRSTLNLGLHPLSDDLVPIVDPRDVPEYPIEILFCDTCKTAHQRFQVPKQKLFPTNYHYRAANTADVIDGMHQLVSACVEELSLLKGKKILDIGCNDGSLLSIFAEAGAQTFGIEPTDAAKEASAAGHKVIQNFLSEEVANHFVRDHGQPDFIVFTNVFAHIEDLPEVIRSLRILSKLDTTIVIENHYLGSVIELSQFDTFYHEHPRTYSYSSFVHIAASLGRSISKLEFPKRYGGNIRVFMRGHESESQKEDRAEILERESQFGDGLVALANIIDLWKTSKFAEIRRAVETHGPLIAKAFPGRSAISLKLLGLNTDYISAIYEKPNSGKVDHFAPGTRIPIRSDDEIDYAAESGPILNFAWHIPSEIIKYLRQRGYTGSFIDIISPNDLVAQN
jgi:SAM-dependent methyltransferase